MAQAAVETAKPAPQPARSDRTLGGLLFAFLLALYLITGSGHLYSPDGEFAFRMSRALVWDSKHGYLVEFRQNLSQWGVMVPLLSQPFVLLPSPLTAALPQKNEATVDGRSYTLDIYRPAGAPSGTPTVGARGPGVADEYVRSGLNTGPAASLAIISYLAFSKDVPQDEVVAEVTLLGAAGEVVQIPLRAGRETAEWSRGRDSPTIAHAEARVASVWSGNTAGRDYYAEIPLGRTVDVRELRIRYLSTQGVLHVRSLALQAPGSTAPIAIPGEAADWSPRENEEYFALLFYGAYNAFVTAAGCVLLFALARLLGYSQPVSAIATLIYGLATSAWPYSKYDFSEPTLTTLLLVALYLVLRWGKDRRDRLLLAAGAAALGAAVTKYVAAVLLPFIVIAIVAEHLEKRPSLQALRSAVRPVATFAIPFVLVAVPAVVYLNQRYGYYPSIFEAWAGIQRGWLPLPFHIGLEGLLFSPGRSVFLYSPPVLLALLSVVPFVRRHGLRSIAIIGIIILYFVLYSKKVAWHGGGGWGPRYQVVIIPLVVLLLAPLIERAAAQRHQFARYALLAVFLLGVGVQTLAVAKGFNDYLGVFRYQIVAQLPDKGAKYGGAEYYRHAEGLTDANLFTATILAWPFSPILGHGWLLTADALHLARPYMKSWEDKVLGMPPWRLMGVDVLPDRPDYGLGLDFWSMRLAAEFPSHLGLLAGAALVLLLLEAVLMFSGARLVRILLAHSRWRGLAVKLWIACSTVLLLSFDGIHLLL